MGDNACRLLRRQPKSERGDVHRRLRRPVLPFDEAAAVHYAEIVAARRREDRAIEAFNAQIAATARVAGTDR
jgi:predicted nucleic acid-binding protein